jgi:hypothetical protein
MLRRPFLGTVEVGTGTPTVIQHPAEFYATADSAVGGGSVGLPGFYMHLESSSPSYTRTSPSYPTYTTTSLSAATIAIKFYGPVEFPDGTMPFEVTYVDNLTSPSVFGSATSMFTATIDPSDNRKVNITRSPESIGDFCEGFYTFIPVTSTDEYSYPLIVRKSDYDPGQTDFPVANDAYTIEVTEGGNCFMQNWRGGNFESVCSADADCDELLSTLDIVEFFSMYFANVTSGGCLAHTADANNDGKVDSADIAVFVDRWFEGCN